MDHTDGNMNLNINRQYINQEPSNLSQIATQILPSFWPVPEGGAVKTFVKSKIIWELLFFIVMFFDITKVHQLNLKHQGGTGQPSILILLSSGLIASKLIALNSVNFKSSQAWASLLGVWGVKIKIWTCVVKFIKKKAPWEKAYMLMYLTISSIRERWRTAHIWICYTEWICT